MASPRAGWVRRPRPATNTSQLAEVAPPMGELYANPQVTQQALDDLFFNVEGELTAQLLEEFALAEGAAFVSGNGTNKPKGSSPTPRRPRQTPAVPSPPSSTSPPACRRTSRPATRQTSSSAPSRRSEGLPHGRGVDDEQERALRGVALQGRPGPVPVAAVHPGQRFGIRLLGFNVEEAEDMPAKAASSLSIAFGNFKRGYTIVDRLGIRMLRDPYTNKPYVGFSTRPSGWVARSSTARPSSSSSSACPDPPVVSSGPLTGPLLRPRCITHTAARATS